jgi:hypothetical protein
MSFYRKIDVRIWADEKFRALSPQRPSAQTLWIFLLCGRHTTSVPGLWNAGEAQLAEALGWRLRDFRRCWAELEDKGMAEADWEAGVVWVPNVIKYNLPDNPNVVRGWKLNLDVLSECELKRSSCKILAASVRELDRDRAKPGQARNGFTRACAEVFGPEGGNGSGNRSPDGSPDGSGKGTANQEQEQYIPPYPPEGGKRGAKYAGEPDFERFWAAYPRKVDKDDALRAWRKLKPSAELADTILTSLEKYRRCADWQRGGGRYVPHPEKWLRLRRWESDPGPAAEGPAPELTDAEATARTLARRAADDAEQRALEQERQARAGAGRKSMSTTGTTSGPPQEQTA